MSAPRRVTRVLLDGLGVGECPRWHDDRLWFCNWGTNQIVAVDVEGNSEVVKDDATVSPHSIDWLPEHEASFHIARPANARPSAGLTAKSAADSDMTTPALQAA